MKGNFSIRYLVGSGYSTYVRDLHYREPTEKFIYIFPKLPLPKIGTTRQYNHHHHLITSANILVRRLQIINHLLGFRKRSSLNSLQQINIQARNNYTNMTVAQQNPLHVVIVGAGLGGLAAAIATRQAGHNVTICEQAPALGEVRFSNP